jgi:hypothetical protein
MRKSKTKKTAKLFGNSADLFRFSNSVFKPTIVVGKANMLRKIEKASLVCNEPGDKETNQFLAAAGYRC